MIAGLVGGIGPEATIEYYRAILALYRERRNDGSAPALLITSIDVQRMLADFAAGRLDEVTEYLAGELERLARAGAGFAALAANTPHLVFGRLAARAPVPLVSIVEVARDAVRAAGLRRVGLFGTRFTMGSRLYHDVFERAGLTVASPDPEEQTYVHEKYLSELVPGIVRAETRAGLLALVERMKARDGIEALILGGTELPLVLRDAEHGGVRFFDTTRLHAAAIVDRLLA